MDTERCIVCNSPATRKCTRCGRPFCNAHVRYGNPHFTFGPGLLGSGGSVGYYCDECWAAFQKEARTAQLVLLGVAVAILIALVVLRHEIVFQFLRSLF